MFLRNVCQSHLPPDWIIRNELGDHSPVREVPAEFRHLPMLGYVRNPWDWYVSWYHFVQQERERLAGSPPESPWVAIFDEGRASFAQAITAACLGTPAGDRPAPAWMDRMQRTGIDLYSSWCHQAFRAGFDGTVEIGRFESLRTDFIAFLRRHEVPVDDSFIGHVMTRPPDNPTPHAPYRSYYTPELRDIVGATSTVAAEYGYSFDDGVTSK
jgi:hypothetical protein